MGKQKSGKERGRFSSKRKADAALRLLRGEALDELSRELGVTAATLGQKAVIQRLPDQPGDVPQTWADLSNADALLGKIPRTAFLDGLRRFVEWFVATGR